jgi:hypothetical protein
MANLITELRGYTEAGTADYTIAGVSYWTDDQLQDILDLHRKDVIFEQLEIYPVQIGGGSISYQDYRSANGFYEATTGGTAILYIQDGTGANIGTANYTADYRRGQFQFSVDQGGSTYYLTGRSYDLNAAAADIWNRKAGHAAQGFSFSTDNHRVDKAQVYKHYKEMAQMYEAMGQESVSTLQVWRSDTDAV